MPSKTDIGHNQEENHVSNTSSSCLKSSTEIFFLIFFTFDKASSLFLATTNLFPS